MSVGTCHAILTKDLHMRNVSTNFVLQLLPEDQKNHRTQVCCDLQHAETNQTFLANITGDELWIFRYDSEIKQQSSQWKHSLSIRSKLLRKARQVWSKQKAMSIAFVDHGGIVHHEFAAAGHTSNQHFCLDALK